MRCCLQVVGVKCDRLHFPGAGIDADGVFKRHDRVAVATALEATVKVLQELCNKHFSEMKRVPNSLRATTCKSKPSFFI